MKKIISGLLFVMILTTSCKKETASTSSDQSGNSSGDSPSVQLFNESGYGSSVKPFKDQAWQLPAGIELTEKFHHFMYCAQLADTPVTTALKNFRGVPGGLFVLCFTLHNNSNFPITIDFPEELAIVSSSIQSQNGLLIGLGQVIVPSNTSLILFAGGFCLNEGRTAPDVYDENGALLYYDFGPSVIPASIKEITGILSGKHIGFDDVVNATGTQYDSDKYAKAFIIQKAIWEVTEGGGLTEKTRQDLKSLSF